MSVFAVVFCVNRFIDRNFRMPSKIDLDRDIDANVNHFDEIYSSLRKICVNQYYDTERFNGLVSDLSQRDFSVMRLNINSTRANGDSLATFYKL